MLLTCKPHGKPALKHVILTSLLDQQQVSRGQISRCFFHKLLYSTGEKCYLNDLATQAQSSFGNGSRFESFLKVRITLKDFHRLITG